jgi:plasmid stabilization system protein ParE
MGQVHWTEIALADLKDVHDYIARDSAYYAAAFVGRVRDSAASLNQLPRRCRITPEFDDPTVRDMIIGKYRLIYRVEERDTVFILAFIHGARDLEKLWDEENRPDPRP